MAKTPHQRFVARVARVEWAFKELLFLYPPHSLEVPPEGKITSFFGKLRANDDRLRRFWEWTEPLSQKEFFELVRVMLGGALGAQHQLMQLERSRAHLNDCKAALLSIERVCKFLKDRHQLVKEAGGRPKKDEDVLVEAIDRAQALKVSLKGMRDVTYRFWESTENRTSRKMKGAPHITFMARLARHLEYRRRRPNYDILAEVTCVIFNVNVGADSVRQAKNRDDMARFLRLKSEGAQSKGNQGKTT